MKQSILIFLLIYNSHVFGQHNMIGKSQAEIMKYYNNDPEFNIKVDTISSSSILITCKTSQPYPFYTYELDKINDCCTSYGFVSKNRETLSAYIDILNHLGQIIQKDSSMINFTYKVETKGRTFLYSIKQPYIHTQMVSRRNLFYVIVTEQAKSKETTKKTVKN